MCTFDGLDASLLRNPWYWDDRSHSGGIRDESRSF